MCGIAAIVSGVSIIGSSPFKETEEVLTSEAKKEYDESVLLNIDDLKAALLRRGPDHLASRKVIVHSGPGTSVKTSVDQVDQSQIPSRCSGKTAKLIASPLETCIHDVVIDKMQSTAQLDFIGATLQLRGLVPVSQPLEDALGNLLVYNGEIFGGINITDDSNDSQVLLHKLEISCSSDCLDFHMNDSCKSEVGKSIPDILSAIKGPWAFIYWQKKSKTMWFGRDAFGRRSMLVHWPTCTDSRFILSSVSPPSFTENYSGSGSLKNGLDNQMANGVSNSTHENVYWEELPCGIYSLELKTSSEKGYFMKEGLLGVVQKHKWMDPLLTKTISWDRFLLDPKIEHDIPIFTDKCSLSADSWKVHSLFAQKVLSALRRSVMRRTKMNSIFQTSVKQHRDKEIAPVAILFSGGLDSMILAALLDQCLNPQYIIDLLNVSFDGQLAPDRVSARLGVIELQKIAPTRRWRLVEIDASLFNLTKEIKHVMSLIHPSNTYMDLNIGIALWLAAGGDGLVDGKICKFLQEDQAHYKYKSEARVLLVGSGADEQCAGYGRHRTKYKHGGWLALHEEMRLDMQRIWKRNLGRDDRLISDNGKEARFPFLDEEVIQTLLEIPLWGIANLDEPVGKGDKKILREVARLLGLEDAAAMPKRAIQFGSRIARESNRRNFGSNRAANQASAGSVKVHEL